MGLVTILRIPRNIFSEQLGTRQARPLPYIYEREVTKTRLFEILNICLNAYQMCFMNLESIEIASQ